MAPLPVRLFGYTLSAFWDPTVFLSFTNIGYNVHRLHQKTEDLSEGATDASGHRRRAVVTGANSGLGLATSKALAALGFDVVLVCRSPDKAAAAAEEVRATAHPDSTVTVVQCDMSEMASVHKAAGELASSGAVDVLVHNAGALPLARGENSNGWETTMALHVCGPQYMTRLLLPKLKDSADARLIMVASGGMYSSKLSTEDWEWKTRTPYDGVKAYAQTKRMQVTLARLWAEKLKDDAPNITVTSQHPGWAATPGVTTSLPTFNKVMKPFLRTTEQGCDSVVWQAASPDARGEGVSGKFFLDRRARFYHYSPFTRETAAERADLWTFVEGLVDGATAGLAEQ